MRDDQDQSELAEQEQGGPAGLLAEVGGSAGGSCDVDTKFIESVSPAVAICSDTFFPTHFFAVRCEQFDGPIDLLLHLVKVRELEIERVSLAQVAQQYLECVERMQELDLDIAAEYLVVAATLVSIKTAALLADPISFEETDEQNMPDPHRELLRRLREAQVFKSSAKQLAGRKLLDVDVFAAIPSLAEIEAPEAEVCTHDALLLGEAFRKVLARSGDIAPLMQISLDSVRVAERMVELLDRLRVQGGWIEFGAVVQRDRGGRLDLIVSFISILELVKRRAVKVRQSESFGEIHLALTGEAGDSAGVEFVSEFDETKVAAN